MRGWHPQTHVPLPSSVPLLLESTLFALGADMELCKYIALYLAVIMSMAYYSFQVHARQPDGGTCKTSVIAEIDGKLLDEVGREFFDKRSGKAESELET